MDKILRTFDDVVLTFNDGPIAFDIETSGFSPWKNSVAVISIADSDGNVAVLHVRGEVPTRVSQWLASRPLLIGHNIVGFDALFMSTHGMDVFHVPWYDTLVGETAVLSSGRHDVSVSLRSTLQRRLGRKAQKGSIDHGGWMNQTLSDEQVEYAATDVIHLHRLMQAQKDRAQGAQANALQTEMDIIPAVIQMSLNGLPLSLEVLHAHLEEQARLLEFEKTYVFDKLGRFKLSSPPQLKKVLQRYGLTMASTAHDQLRNVELMGGPTGEIMSHLLVCRSAQQRLNMYKPEWVDKYYMFDGRIHARFWQCGTETGRFSSSDPNLQQVPKDMRGIFVAPDGHKIVSADYSQIEVRLAAAAAQDEALLQTLEADDVHTAVASAMFGIPVEQVTKDQRVLAKACSFTLMFGGGAKTLYHHTRMGGGALTEAEAQKFVAMFFGKYQGLARMRENAQQMAWRKTPVTLNLPTGLKRVLVGDNLTSTRILNTVVQGAAAAGLKFALKKCIERGLYKQLCATIHDELVAVVPEAHAENYAEELKLAMVDGMKVFTDAPIKVEARVERSWG